MPIGNQDGCEEMPCHVCLQAAIKVGQMYHLANLSLSSPLKMCGLVEVRSCVPVYPIEPSFWSWSMLIR